MEDFEKQQKLYHKWWFWIIMMLMTVCVCFTFMMMNASWNPTIVRFEANQELKDTITFMSNNSDYHYREFLESDALLKSCNYELEFEKSKLCNGEKEISNMRAAMGEGYLSGCINGCDYYTIFNLYKIHEDNFNGCRSFCKSLADSYG